MTILGELYRDKTWRILDEEVPLLDGGTKRTTRAYRVDSAVIIASPRPGKILLLKEYRPFLEKHLWILPSGRIDKETDAYEGAMRELQEETEYRAKKMKPYFTFLTSESVVQYTHVFLAEDLVHEPLPRDSDEHIEVHEKTPDEAIELVMQNDPMLASTTLVLLKYMKDHPNG